MTISVQVRYFAGAAAAAGVAEERLALDPPVTVGTVRAALEARRPALSPVLAVASLLLDEVAVRDPSALVRDGATVDVLPPFAGG